MQLVADIFLGAGALGAGLYCLVLARRLKRFNDLEQGVGGAVAVLSSQVDELNGSLSAAQSAAQTSNQSLTELTERAEAVASRLELIMASMHDLPEEPAKPVVNGTPVPPEPPAPQPPAPPEPEIAPVAAEPIFVRHERRQAGGAR